MRSESWNGEAEQERLFIAQAMHAHARREYKLDKRRRLRKALGLTLFFALIFGAAVWLAVMAWGQQ